MIIITSFSVETNCYEFLGKECSCEKIREVVNGKGKIEQPNDNYPSAATYSKPNDNTSDLQPYKYTGKELDLVHGLNTYDHGARQNYSILGVWDKIDPLVEKYYNISPFAVCGDDPVKYLDPNGKIWKDINGKSIKNQDNIKVYIFYSNDFSSQAKAQYDDAVKIYGSDAVALSETDTRKYFDLYG